MAEVEINPVQKPQFVSNVENTNPIRITTVAPHGLLTGAFAFVCHVGGALCANLSFVQTTKIDDDTFSFDGIDGTNPPCGAYTSGGVYSPARETVHEVTGSGSSGLRGQGPWLYNGLLHTLVSDSGDAFAGVAGLFVMRRDLGGAWVKLDTGSAFLPPGTPSTGRSQRGCFRQGTDIWIMRVDHVGAAENAASISTTFYAPQKFDLLTSQWSAPENSGTLPRSEGFSTGTGAPPNNGADQKIRDLSELVVRSTGELIFLHPHFRDLAADGKRYARVWYQRRSAGGVWDDPPIRVFGTAGEQKSYSSRDFCIDSNDRVHFFGLRAKTGSTWGASSSEGEIVYRNLDAAGTLSGQVTVVDAVHRSLQVSPVGPAYIYTDSGGTERIVVPYNKGRANGSFPAIVESLSVIRGNAVASPTWTTEVITNSSPSMPAGQNLPGGNRNEMHVQASFCYDSASDTLHCFWQTDPGQVTGVGNGNPSEVYHSTQVGGPGNAWSTPAIFKTGNGLTSNWGINSLVPVTDAEQPVWYGQPVPTLVGTNIEVIFGRFAKWQVEDCGQQGSFASVSRTHEFPHIDQVSLCPPAGAANYAFFY